MVTEQGQDGDSSSHCCLSLGMTCLNDKHNEGGTGGQWSSFLTPLHEFGFCVMGRGTDRSATGWSFDLCELLLTIQGKGRGVRSLQKNTCGFDFQKWGKGEI